MPSSIVSVCSRPFFSALCSCIVSLGLLLDGDPQEQAPIFRLAWPARGGDLQRTPSAYYSRQGSRKDHPGSPREDPRPARLPEPPAHRRGEGALPSSYEEVRRDLHAGLSFRGHLDEPLHNCRARGFHHSATAHCERRDDQVSLRHPGCDDKG